MKREFLWIVVLMLVLSMGISACARADADEGSPSESDSPALVLTGMVEAETSWSLADLQAREPITVEMTDEEGETVQNTGVKLLDLLDEAGLQGGAGTLTFVGSDGYEAQVEVAEIESCADCIVAINDDGTLGMVLPGFSGKFQVKGVVEIRVE